MTGKKAERERERADLDLLTSDIDTEAPLLWGVVVVVLWLPLASCPEVSCVLC